MHLQTTLLANNMIVSTTISLSIYLKKNLKLILFIFCTLFTYNRGFAQADLPKIIQPSPEATALFRFQDYPMDYSTGLPQISIPIYSITVGSISVPISLSYHASGRRVSDQDGPIALGWILNAGGMISRTIYGSPDFGTNGGNYKFPYPFKTDFIGIVNDLGYLEKINHFDKNPDDCLQGNWMDSEYDLFSYSFGDKGGKFIFKDDNNIKTPVLLPDKPYVVVPIYDVTGLENINITDDKGTLYHFVATETHSLSGFFSGYSLYQIISADKVDTITFKYSTFIEDRVSISQQIVINDLLDLHTAENPYPTDVIINTESTNRDKYQISRLTEIDFRDGKAIFNLQNGSDKVSNIAITNSVGQTIKTIEFNKVRCDNLAELGYVTNSLSNIIFKDNIGAAVEKYQFEYYPTVTLNGQVNARYIDWWGYYNNSGEHDMVPGYTVNVESYAGTSPNNPTNIGNASSKREPNLAALESGVLKKIIFPTGGSTEFTYENNKCKLYGSTTSDTKLGPGLRLYKTTTTEKDNNTIFIKTYKYGENEVGYGNLDLFPDMKYMAIQSFYNYIGPNQGNDDPNMGGTYRQRIFYSEFIPDLTYLANKPVMYKEVTEYFGTETNNNGKAIYTFDYTSSPPANMPVFENMALFRYHMYDCNYWDLPSLLSKKTFKKIETIPYSKITSETNNIYSTSNSGDIVGLHVQRIHNVPQKDRVLQTGKYPERSLVDYNNPYNPFHPVQIYTYNEYRIRTGFKNLTATLETQYNDDGTEITNKTNYNYNSKQLISKITKISSDNKSLITDIKYPFDYSGNTVLTKMVTLNMLNYPVEQTDTKNTSPVKALQSVRTNYYDWGSTIPHIAPQSIETKKGTNSYETRMTYNLYDEYGNPKSISKDKDVHLSYIWDYNHSNPIAEVVNADPTDIAYTSFESDGNGGWNGINSANISSTTSGITGLNFYNLNSAGLLLIGLTPSKEYTVSYWSKNGAYTVPGTKSGWPKNIRTVTLNGVTWTCWEHKATGVTQIKISGTGAIDELRFYPSTAQMKTYTYRPLIGISSINDANNRISFYEYDAYGRLNLIKDINGNVIKTMTYQYQSSTP